MQLNDSAPEAPGSGALARRARARRVMKWVRKFHMYAGLLLFPWVIFFGVSGILFNHPGIGGDDGVTARPLSAEELGRRTGLRPLDPAVSARAVAARLAGGGYRLDPDYAPHFEGFTAFVAPGAGVTHMLLVDVGSGGAVLMTRPRPEPTAPFAGAIEPPDAPGLASMEAGLSELLGDLDIEAGAPLRAHPRIAPELRFRVLDAEGGRWNVTYGLGGHRVDGRRTDEPPDLSLHDLLGAMHTTHHYPNELGVRSAWALFADLTGLILVFWALTGVVMWWQIKPARRFGIASVVLALGVAVVVMVGLHRDLRFGDVLPAGPGGPAPPPATADRGATPTPTAERPR